MLDTIASLQTWLEKNQAYVSLARRNEQSERWLAWFLAKFELSGLPGEDDIEEAAESLGEEIRELAPDLWARRNEMLIMHAYGPDCDPDTRDEILSWDLATTEQPVNP